MERLYNVFVAVLVCHVLYVAICLSKDTHFVSEEAEGKTKEC